MKKRALRIGIRIVIAILAVVAICVGVSLSLIDRGDPVVVGTLTPEELKAIRQAVKGSAAWTTAYWLKKGDFSLGWHCLKEMHTYRIKSVEVLDADAALVFTRTNIYYPSGMRRPDFFVRRSNGSWQASPPGPIL